jgi:hypothetical protein
LNLAIPPLVAGQPDDKPVPTLEDQANGKDVLRVATDIARPAGGSRRLTIDKIEQIIQLYRDGLSVDAVRQKLSVSWNTAARVLNEAGLREATSSEVGAATTRT